MTPKETQGILGVIIPLVSATLESNLLQGIQTTAVRMGYDMLVFTNSTNSQEGYADEKNEAILGEESVYSLAGEAQLDGVLFCAGRMGSQRVREKIAALLQERRIPVLSVEWEDGPFPSFTLSEREALRLLTAHLIEVHDCRRVYCLTGPEGLFESEDRLLGWKDALDAHGITPEENWVFYGDFWKARAKELADQIADGLLPMPDGIVCANDAMAIALCKALKARGIDVPGQIAVTGFDGDLSGELSEPTITTVSGRNLCFGEQAAARLIEMIGGGHYEPEPEHLTLTIRQSCGCQKEDHNYANTRYYSWLFERNEYKQVYMNCNYEMDLYAAESLPNLAFRISCYTYFIPEQSQLDIYLCEDWCGDLAEPEVPENASFSPRMLHLLSQNWGGSTESTGTIPLHTLLPALHQPHPPMCVVFQPLHFKGSVFGYVAMRYDNVGDYFMDEHFLRWRNAISNALAFLRERMHHRYIADQLEALSTREPFSGMYNEKGFRLQADAFLERIRSKGQPAGIMLISWAHISASHEASGEKLGLLFAHALQMLCGSDLLPARIHAQVYVILFPFAGTETVEEFETTLLFRIERSLRMIQQRNDSEFPDLTAVSEQIPDDAAGVPDLGELTERLNQKMELYTRQRTNFTVELKAIRRQIRISPESAVSAGEAADLLGISESYFVRLFKSQFGVPYNEEVIQARLHKAKKLLRDTNFSVKEIADRCGYASASHFMRQFKDKVGVTAVAYRKSHAAT